MFTGIIESTGVVADMNFIHGDLVLALTSHGLESDHLQLGDSIAVNGVCLTLVDKTDNLRFDVSRESLSKTDLESLKTGDTVNLETALTLQKALGGHLVSGHVDGLAEIIEITPSARSTVFLFRTERRFAQFIAEKGSVTIDGISLTVNHVADFDDHVEFDVNIVPHTLEHTNLGSRVCGDKVHLEIDQVARYLARLLETRNGS